MISHLYNRSYTKSELQKFAKSWAEKLEDVASSGATEKQFTQAGGRDPYEWQFC